MTHPSGCAIRREEGEFEQQDAQHLAPREAEHPQACQFPRALRKRDARAVVDDSECDDGGKAGVDAGHRGDEQGHVLAKVGKRNALQRQPLTVGMPLIASYRLSSRLASTLRLTLLTAGASRISRASASASIMPLMPK